MAQALSDLLGGEITLLRELVEISKTLATLGEPDDKLVGGLIDRRSSLLADLDQCEKRASEIARPSPLNDDLKAKADTLKALAFELSGLETKAARNLETLLESLKKKSSELEKGRQTLLLYAGSKENLSRFTDRRG